MLKELIEKFDNAISNLEKEITSVDNAISDLYNMNSQMKEEISNKITENTEAIKENTETNKEIIRLLNIIINKMDSTEEATSTTIEEVKEPVQQEVPVISEVPEEPVVKHVEPVIENNVKSEPVKPSQKIMNDCNDVFSFFESMAADKEAKEQERIRQAKQDEELTVESVLKRFGNRGIDDINKNINMGSMDSIFKTSIDEQPHVEQPQPNTYTVPPQNQQQQTFNSNTNFGFGGFNTQPKREFGFRFDKFSKKLTIICNNDNSTMDIMPNSPAYELMVTKLHAENRKISSLTDEEYLEFIRTILIRERETGMNMRGCGQTFDMNYKPDNTSYSNPYTESFVNASQGFGYEEFNNRPKSKFFY